LLLTGSAGFNYFTCHNYIQALHHGVKYIYRTMPRMLTIWLDLGDHRAQDYNK
jgi:serine/threonine-protein kinase ATR